MDFDNPVPAPKSSSTCLVFPFSSLTNQYDSSFYDPTMTDGRATYEEVSQILIELQDSYNEIIADMRSATMKLMILGLLIVPLVCLIFVKTLRFLYQSYIDEGTFAIAIALICTYFAGRCFSSAQARNQTERETAPHKIFAQANQSFVPKGLRWVVPLDYPWWVELHKVYAMDPNTISDSVPLNIEMPDSIDQSQFESSY